MLAIEVIQSVSELRHSNACGAQLSHHHPGGSVCERGGIGERSSSGDSQRKYA